MKHNWEYKKLGEIAYFESGSRPSGGVRGINNGVLSLGGEHIDINGYLNLTSPKYVSKHYFESNLKGHIKDGDILLCKDGALTGKVALVRNELNGIDAMINEHVFILRTNMLFQPYLFKYLFSKVGQQELKSRITGAAQGGLNRNNLSTTLIPLPPLSVQERIVEELDRLSLILEKKKQQIKELDSLAQSIFYDMFGDPIENEKDWEVKKLGEVGEIVTGSTPSTTDNTNWNGKINWVTPAELSNQLFYGATQRRLTEKGAKNLTLMPVGTVLLSSRAPIGKIAITTQPMCCNQGFKNIICGEYLNNIFLYYYLLITLENIKALGCGATFKEVSKKAIYSYETILPPLDLQQSFAKKIEVIEKQKELINQSIKEVQLLFDAKMDYYFGD